MLVVLSDADLAGDDRHLELRQIPLLHFDTDRGRTLSGADGSFRFERLPVGRDVLVFAVGVGGSEGSTKTADLDEVLILKASGEGPAICGRRTDPL